MQLPGAIRVVGRYTLHGELASGGMATVLYGRLRGPVGFSRTVAIKRLHSQYAKDPEFVSMFVDEARLAARIHHPNVVGVHDAVATAGELFLVMDYVSGESLAALARGLRERKEAVPASIAVAIVTGVLHGLHAAHELKGTKGEPLGIVHRDVSPHNVLVGTDGIARVLDFGIAKATGRLHTSRDGQLKGKLAYMSPEQIRGLQATRQSDIYSASVVLWELLTGKRLFTAENEGSLVEQVLLGFVDPPSSVRPELAPSLDAIVLRGTDTKPERRFGTAREMALALEKSGALAMPSAVGEWVEWIAGETLAERARRVAEIEIEAETGPRMTDVLAELSASVGSSSTKIMIKSASNLPAPGPPLRPAPSYRPPPVEDDPTDPDIDERTLPPTHAPVMHAEPFVPAPQPADPPSVLPLQAPERSQSPKVRLIAVVALVVVMLGVALATFLR